MKHPNKKYEAIRKEYAWALMVRKRHAENSCFNFWLDKNDRVEKVDLTEDKLLNSIANIRRGSKIVSVELNDL